MNIIEKIKNKDIIILGCAPDLNKFDYRKYKNKNTIIIALNSAFLKWYPDILFFADKRFYRRYRHKISKNLFCICPNNLKFRTENIFIYSPSKLITKNINKLKAGHSVIIPAFHFACIVAKKIIITGWEMDNKSHWDNKSIRPFPSTKKIVNEMLEIQSIFQKEVIYI